MMSWIIFTLVLAPLLGAYDAYAHWLRPRAGLGAVASFALVPAVALAIVALLGHGTSTLVIALLVALTYAVGPGLRMHHHRLAVDRASAGYSLDDGPHYVRVRQVDSSGFVHEREVDTTGLLPTREKGTLT